ncbi:hypothetical protein ACGF1Z_35105 [Streptomyces sp. NPDC048018]|uniref:hypothetical protein n=1 Tax=Streptomyces sp. NPDC048018 TaxID=3365499 RepID=UPI0037123293
MCNRERPVHVTWPLGAVCGPCCIRRRHHPGTCAFCREPGTLVGRTETGDEVCGTCCGGGPVFTCVTCNSTGNPYAEGRCTRCTLRSRVDALLAAENAKPWMERLAHCLANAPQPRSVIHWLDHSQAGRLLASLVTTCTEPTHDVLDDLPQEPRTRYVRGLLVAAKVLPERNEYLAQTELWLARTVDSLPPGQRGYVHAFAEWHVLNRARRQADRGRFSDASATHARTDILRAIYFLDWLGGQGLALATAPQSDLDRWITEKPGQRNGLVAFIRWSRRRRITGLRLTASLSGLPQTFLEESELHDQLHRCLTDDELPLEVRVSGALVRLFGLPVSRVADLTVAAFTRDETGAYLTISTAPVLLPPRLAALVEALVILRRHPTAVGPAPDSDPGYLFPGKTPGRPRSANAIRGRLTGHGLGTLAARNSAMAALMTDLPPQIVSDLLGFSPDTTTQWAAYFQDSWAHYLAARSHPESP